MFEGIFGKKKQAETGKEEKKAAFHITIRDNETGEVTHDCDSDVIIGAFDVGGERTNGVAMTKADANKILNVVMGARNSIDSLLKANPKLLMMANMIDVIKRMEKENTDEGENSGQ